MLDSVLFRGMIGALCLVGCVDAQAPDGAALDTSKLGHEGTTACGSSAQCAPGSYCTTEDGECRSTCQEDSTEVCPAVCVGTCRKLQEASSERPYAIRCSLNYRKSNEVGEGETGEEPKFQFTETSVNVAAGEESTARFGELTFRAFSSAMKEEGGALSLSVGTDSAMLASWLYQFDPDSPPLNQFQSHGFTGLIYLRHPELGGDYQLFCETVRR